MPMTPHFPYIYIARARALMPGGNTPGMTA